MIRSTLTNAIKLTSVIIIILFTSQTHINGQSTKLTGTVIDSTSQPLVAATVVLLQEVDSVMVSFALSDENGNFVINNVNPGSYLLQITYIGYGNFRQKLTVEKGIPTKKLGIIFLSPKNTLLEEVVVKAQHVPIVIKNDTIEYNADAFVQRPNAVVEDLLKSLPGVEVKRDGSIKAQGEDVQNVLVDGKEFFGKDPKIATQNLPAEIVDKVQVYDKQSEMAEFSGIDDGQEEKTINLSLKEDKKKGYFGNLEGGIGIEDSKEELKENRYKAKLSLNRFDNRLQFSILGMANNINEQGFSFNEYINFMGGFNSLMTGGMIDMSLDAGGVGIAIGGMNEQQGINSTMAGGVNFNYDFSKNVEWQSSYFINSIDNLTTRIIRSQNLAGESGFNKFENLERNNQNLNHRLSTSLRLKLDTTTQVTWINRLSFNTGDFSSRQFIQSETDENLLINESDNYRFNSGRQFSWNTDLTIRQRLNKPGRILSGNINYQMGDNTSEEFLDNLSTFYDNGMPQNVLAILQDQENDLDENQYRLKMTFTEPISKRSFFGLTAQRSNFTNDRLREYYDIDPLNPSSRTLNLDLSNHFKRNYLYNSLGANLRYVGKAFKLTIASDLQRSELMGEILSEGMQLNKNFTYFLPRLNAEYELGTSKNLRFSYRTRVNEPDLQQLQPTLDNSNPLLLYLGNPELKPEYTHEGNIHLMLFDQFSFTGFFANINLRYTKDRIVNQSSIDDQLRQVIQPINSKNGWNANAYTSFDTPLKFIKSKINIDYTLNFNKGFVFVNALENSTKRWTNNLTITLENRKKEHFDVAVGASMGWNDVTYSESSSFDQDYFDQTYFMDLILNLPLSFTLESTLDYTNYSQETFASKDKQTLWRASISKRFLANEQLTLTFSVFDILDQNKGISRSNTLNYIQESRTNVLGRYFMLSMNYKLSKFGNQGGMSMEVHDRRR